MFGQIAAANALSDVYAMGGEPKTVLNIVGFPIKKLGEKVLADILRGAADKVTESGAVIIGGHSIEDQEPKFGMSITGLAHPKDIWTNAGARPGDALVLTKPIGVGILTTGIKRNAVTPEQEQKVTETMAALNKTAAACLRCFEVHAATDVTGFGLLGHGSEMARGSNVSIVMDYAAVPLLPGTKELAAQGIIPGGTKANHAWLQDSAAYSAGLSMEDQFIMCDAVTSGGLLVSLPEAQAVQYVQLLHESGVSEAAIVGRVTEKQEKWVYVN